MKYRVLERVKKLLICLSKYHTLYFFIAMIIYLELVYRLWNFKSLSIDFVFPVLFALTAGTVLFLMSNLWPQGVNRIVAILLALLVVLIYTVQLLYYRLFQTPLSIYSFTGTNDVLQFREIILSAILKNIFAVILLWLPLVAFIVILKKISFSRVKSLSLWMILIFGFVSYGISVVCIHQTGESNITQYTLYYKVSSPDLSVRKLGLMTTMRLDFERLAFGLNKSESIEGETDTNEPVDSNDSDGKPCFVSESATSTNAAATPKSGIITPTPVSSKIESAYNLMNIDFKSLIAKEKDKTLIDMHKYFSTVSPTKKNQYTGIFQGDNLILITAEAFSHYAISPELTPTLYKLSTEGFVFKNFYNPIWGVSTSDGEYVACTGLIPKSGVWSFSVSAKNYMPFVMGNQFKKQDYLTKAYHDHSYSYYKRDKSHPNMGYDYKGVGNGLNIKKSWPESDLEMIEVTSSEFISQKPFHTYFMTVSGHLNYSFTGNYIARKNKPLVEKLPYSDEPKAYIAANLELEFAIKALIDKLETAGVADKTVIAISADHYPYGLPREAIDELAGHKVESNFELYKSSFILWKKGMEPVVIDKPCSSLDIIPTLSNLFGLEYDSRLLMGSDILSDTPPLVIFSNRSWITDKAMYNTLTNDVKYKGSTKKDSNFVKAINSVVAKKFKYSAKILEKDYYRKVIP